MYKVNLELTTDEVDEILMGLNQYKINLDTLASKVLMTAQAQIAEQQKEEAEKAEKNNKKQEGEK